VLDDFGTGYSSLAYLRRLPLDTIKADRAFVSGLGDTPLDMPIVRTVVALAHGLGVDVVAEGIETPAQLAELQGLDCDRGQGFWFARPLPADEIEQLLASASGPRAVLPVQPLRPAIARISSGSTLCNGRQVLPAQLLGWDRSCLLPEEIGARYTG
jgi:predicted signal transduction protein with EAL and GGDEF domain